ncbi:MAG: ribonuclease III [Nakamurella sp.]
MSDVAGSEQSDGEARLALLQRVGLDLAADSLELALTHRSYAYENGGLPTNERLEFLGDSVLGIIITDELYRTHPDQPEGQLAKLRASIVNMHALAAVGHTLGLGQLLLLGRGEELTGGREKPSIVSDAVEALLGALYLEHGIEPVREAVLHLFHGLLMAAPRLGAGLDWKTSLQELSAGHSMGVPSYDVDETGPDHDKTFTAHSVVGGDVLGEGVGHTKKQAEQLAAAQAYRVIMDRTSVHAGADAADTNHADAVDTDAGAS